MKNAHFILLILTTFLFSCSDSDQDGDWDDNIELSQKVVQFTASENSILITTKKEGWWINGVSLNGNSNFKQSETADGGFLINEDEFVVERKSSTELYIKITANTTDSERILIIGLQNGNYFDGVRITQSAK